MNIRATRTLAATGLAGLAIIATGTYISHAQDSASNGPADASELVVPIESRPAPVYPTNADGQAYGSELDAPSPDQLPDLIYAIATNGKYGYVRRDDLHPSAQPTSPEEAIAQNSDQPREIPVYETDGKTQIGTYVVQAGQIEEEAAQ